MGKLSGKASYLKIQGQRVEITKAAPKIKRDMKETTDSKDYDPTSDMLYPSQIPVKVGTEIAIEGNYYLESTGPLFLNWAFSGEGARDCILYLTQAAIFGHGKFDLSDFEAEDPIDDLVTFSATLTSNGIFTPNS